VWSKKGTRCDPEWESGPQAEMRLKGSGRLGDQQQRRDKRDFLV